MSIAIRILQKVLVNYFYKANAGLFLFGFFVLFGLPYSPLAFHLSLITGIIQSRVFLAVVMLTWFLYNLKCLDYLLKQLRNFSQSFLYCFTNLPAAKIYMYMLFVQVMVYAPVLIYSTVIIFIAAKKHQYWCIAEIIFFNMTVAAASAFIYFLAIQKNTLFRQIVVTQFKINLPKPFFSIPLYFLWNDRKQMLFVTKFFSLLFLYMFLRLYEPERYDIRPLQLCLLITAASHSAIVFEVRTFEEEFLAFNRNLPLNTINRFIQMTAMYAFLLLPEFIFLFKGYPIHFSIKDYPQLVLLVIALLSMFHVMLLLEDTDTEQLMRLVFGIIAACFFIILYNPGIVLPSAILLLSFALFNAYYYSFEKKYK